MAKFGNFVHTEYLNISEKETEMFKAFITEKVMNKLEAFRDDLKLSMEVDTNSYALSHTDIIIKFDKPLNGRSTKKERIFNLKDITFMIYKNKGYLEKRENGEYKKDYDNAPIFQYSLLVSINGMKIHYKCRTKTGINCAEAYQYGTELSDFNMDNILYDLKQIIWYLK